ncbi:hypothetical protein LJC15_01130 [Desulfovibrio sp. OttesenSCG-928-G11]|nr:hypothetical protein [Desulfovibrio sp. OttesenSCG-928-G11]
MKEKINQLVSILGSHMAVAEALEYSERQYRNIRNKILLNEPIGPRIEALISWKLKELQSQGDSAKKGE